MNVSRVFGAFLAVLVVVGTLSFTEQVWAQETTTTQVQSTGPDYSYDSLEILAPYVAGDGESATLTFSLLLKNTSPDQRNYRLGVDFRNPAATGSDRLYIARVPELYTLSGNAQERIEFTIPSPKFLSGVYTVSVGASDEKGNPVGMARLDDMKFSGTETVTLSGCALAGQSLSDGVKVKSEATAKANVVCRAAWSGEEENMTKVSVRLADFRYAPASEIGQASTSLSKQGSSVTVSLAQALPAGFYQLEIVPLDSADRPVGVSVRSPIAVEGVGGKIVSIADTAVVEKDGKSSVSVSVLTEAYDASTYQVALSLASEGQACAAPLSLPLDVTMNEVTGEFALTKECQYPVIMATLSDASGKKLDQAVRAFGERVPVRAAVGVPAKNDTASSSMISWGLVLLFSLPILIVILYLARKRMNVTRMMPLLFALTASVVFFSETGQVQAANVGFNLNYYCWPDDPCPEATTIFVHYNVKDTFSPGEDIIIGQMLGSDDYPITPVTGGAFFGVNDANYTGNLDGKSYKAQELREGVFNNYSDVKLKAPMTPGTFTLSLGVTMSGYINYYPKVVTLRVVGSKTECPAPGWGEGEAVYDGWAGSAPGWCQKYPSGRCTSDTGGNSASTTGSITSCCDAEMSVDNIAYVRDCQGGKGGGVDVTMTGKAKQVGFWKHFTNTAEASGPTVNIAAGGTALLTWTSTGAASCTLTVPPAAGRNVALNATDYPITGLSAGTHILTIDCEDASGTRTDSDSVTVNVNSAPNAPTINGPATGVTNTSYDYVITSTDPDGDTLRYGFDGDGNNSVDQFYPSTGYVNSGIPQTARKSWSTPGTYTIQASAQDSKGAGSNFTPKTITITNPVAAALNICPTSATINEGGYTQLAAWYTPTGTTFNGCAAPNGTNQSGSASWSSSNSGVASVNATGRVSGVTPGSASIGATYSGVSDTTPTSVTVLCTPKDSCSSQSSQDKADLVCTTDTFTIPDGCGNNIVCNGARSCDYNWKEVAP